MNRANDLRTEIKRLEDKLKEVEEKNTSSLKSIEKENETQKVIYNHQLELKDLEYSGKLVKFEMRMYATIISLLIGIATFLIGYFGREYINKEISVAINDYAKPKVDSVIENTLTNGYIDTVVRQKAELAIGELITEYKAKGDTAIDESINDIYNRVQADLKNKKFNLTGEIPKNIRNQLIEYKKVLEQLKSESEYSFDDWYLKATAERQKENYKQAIESYSSALRMQPGNLEVLFFRALSYSNNGNYEKAIKDYTKIIQSSSETLVDHAPVYHNRAGDYMALNKNDEAISDLNKSIQLNPGNAALSYVVRGALMSEKKEYGKAIEDFTKAINIDSTNYEYFLNRGNAYGYINNVENAIKDYSKAANLNPKDGYIFVSLAGFLIISNEFEQALLNAQKAYPLLSGKSYSLLSNVEIKAVCKWEECIALKLLGRNTEKAELDLEALLTQDFKLKWRLFGIENWLSTAKISNDDKEFIRKKIKAIESKR